MVKAGPKKRRAKSEAELIASAVEEHGARGMQVGKRNGKVRTYSYKKPVKKKTEPKRKLSLDKSAEGLNDRNRRDWEPWEEAILFVEPTKVLDELVRKQIECEHKPLKTARPLAVLGEEREWRTCPTCQSVLRWWGSYTTTLQGEWMSYRVDGYPMEEWGELFTKDKSLWIPMIEEAAYLKNTDEEVGNEDDN